jgi:hypothetical protein
MKALQVVVAPGSLGVITLSVPSSATPGSRVNISMTIQNMQTVPSVLYGQFDGATITYDSAVQKQVSAFDPYGSGSDTIVINAHFTMPATAVLIRAGSWWWDFANQTWIGDDIKSANVGVGASATITSATIPSGPGLSIRTASITIQNGAVACTAQIIITINGASYFSTGVNSLNANQSATFTMPVTLPAIQGQGTASVLVNLFDANYTQVGSTSTTTPYTVTATVVPALTLALQASVLSCGFSGMTPSGTVRVTNTTTGVAVNFSADVAGAGGGVLTNPGNGTWTYTAMDLATGLTNSATININVTTPVPSAVINSSLIPHGLAGSSQNATVLVLNTGTIDLTAAVTIVINSVSYRSPASGTTRINVGGQSTFTVPVVLPSTGGIAAVNLDIYDTSGAHHVQVVGSTVYVIDGPVYHRAITITTQNVALGGTLSFQYSGFKPNVQLSISTAPVAAGGSIGTYTQKSTFTSAGPGADGTSGGTHDYITTEIAGTYSLKIADDSGSAVASFSITPVAAYPSIIVAIGIQDDTGNTYACPGSSIPPGSGWLASKDIAQNAKVKPHAWIQNTATVSHRAFVRFATAGQTWNTTSSTMNAEATQDFHMDPQVGGGDLVTLAEIRDYKIDVTLYTWLTGAPDMNNLPNELADSKLGQSFAHVTSPTGTATVSAVKIVSWGATQDSQAATDLLINKGSSIVVKVEVDYSALSDSKTPADTFVELQYPTFPTKNTVAGTNVLVTPITLLAGATTATAFVTIPVTDPAIQSGQYYIHFSIPSVMETVTITPVVDVSIPGEATNTAIIDGVGLTIVGWGKVAKSSDPDPTFATTKIPLVIGDILRVKVGILYHTSSPKSDITKLTMQAWTPDTNAIFGRFLVQDSLVSKNVTLPATPDTTPVTFNATIEIIVIKGTQQAFVDFGMYNGTFGLKADLTTWATPWEAIANDVFTVNVAGNDAPTTFGSLLGSLMPLILIMMIIGMMGNMMTGGLSGGKKKKPTPPTGPTIIMPPQQQYAQPPYPYYPPQPQQQAPIIINIPPQQYQAEEPQQKGIVQKVVDTGIKVAPFLLK